MNFRIFLWALTFLSPSARADQLVPFRAERLSGSPYVVIGRVKAVTFDEGKSRGTMEIEVLSAIKGKLGTTSFKLNADKNPLSGFDIVLDKNEIAVFFLQKIESGVARLIAPGASVPLPKGYFR